MTMTDVTPGRRTRPALEPPATLVDALDRLLTTGVVVQGEVVLSVASVDLLYLGLNLVLASVDTIGPRDGARRRG